MTDKAYKLPETEIKIKVTPPQRCNSCGTKSKNMANGWLGFNIGVTGVLLFSCPKCGAVYVNTEAEHNLNRIRAMNEAHKERRILLPGGN